MPERQPRFTSPTLIGALLVLLTVAVHWPALSGGFVYDDELLMGPTNEATSSIRAAIAHTFDPLWSFDRATPVTAEDRAPERAFWRPLTVLAFAIGRALPGEGAFGPHVVSLILHALAALVAWRLAARLLGHTLAGAAVAALFAVHPVQVEPVAWAAAVNDPLAGLFVLGALLAHTRWRDRADSNETTARGGGLRHGEATTRGVPLLGGVCAFTALLAKEQALILPVLVVGLDLARSRRVSGRSLAPYFVAVGLWYLARAVIFRDVFAGLVARQGDFGFAGLGRELSFRVELLGGFLSMLVWPSDLAVFRPVRPALPVGDASVWHGALWLAAFTVLAILAGWRRKRIVLFGLGLVLVTPLLVAMALHTAGRYPLSDRYLYLSVFGAALALVAFAWRALPRAATLGGCAALVLASAIGARAHVGTFASPAAFTARAVAAAPEDPYVQSLAGRFELQRYGETIDQRRLLDAYRHFLLSLTAGTDYGARQVHDDPALPLRERIARLEHMMLAPAAERRPDPTVFWTPFERLEANLGQLYVHLYTSDQNPLDTYDAALEIANQLVQLFGHEARVWTAKGQVHQKRRELDEAEQAYRKALERDRGDRLAWRQLAAVLTMLGRDSDTRRAYEDALELAPTDLALRLGALSAALREKQVHVAEAHLAELNRHHPGTRETALMRGRVEYAHGRYKDALDAFDRALALDPGYGDAQKHRGLAQLQLHDLPGALESLGNAARTMPDDFESHYQVAALLDMLRPIDREEDPAQKAQRVQMMVRAYELSPPDEYRLHLQDALLPHVAGDPDATFTLATHSEKRHDLVSARFWLDRTRAAAAAWPEAERKENLVQALTRLGSVLRQSEAASDHKDAVNALREAIVLAPTNFDAHFELAWALHNLKRLPECGAASKRALELFDSADISDDWRRAVRQTLQGWVEEAEEANAAGPPAPR